MTLVNLDAVEAVVAADASLSTAIDTNGRTPLWVETPAALTGGVLTFVAVDDDDADRVLRDPSGAEVKLTLGAAGARHSLMPEVGAQLAGHRRIKLRAGTAASPAVQAAARTLRLALRNVL